MIDCFRPSIAESAKIALYIKPILAKRAFE